MRKTPSENEEKTTVHAINEQMKKRIFASIHGSVVTVPFIKKRRCWAKTESAAESIGGRAEARSGTRKRMERRRRQSERRKL